jgi:hypothetical protein
MDLIRSAWVAKKIGRIAQLEERCPYKAEVTGSIPVPPTIERPLVRRDRKCACRAEDLFLHSGIDRRPTISSCRAAVLPSIDLRGRRSAWLGRQIVNLEVAGSNPVGPAIFFRVWYTPLCQGILSAEEGE